MPSWLNSELDINAVKASVKKLSSSANSDIDIASIKSSVKKTMSPFLATEKGATSVASKHFGFMKKKMSRSGAAPQESSEVPVSVASKHFNNPFKKQPSMKKNMSVVEEALPVDKAPIVDPNESRTESPAMEDSSSMATERMASPVMVEEVKSDDAATAVKVDNIKDVVKDNTKEEDSGRDSRASVRSVSKEVNSSMSSGDEMPPKDQPVEVMDSPVVAARDSPVVVNEEEKEEETIKEDERKEEEALDEETVMTMAKTAPALVVATADDRQGYVTEESFDSFEEASIEAVQHDGRVALGFFVHGSETEETTAVDAGVMAQTMHFANTMMEKHLACLNPCVDKVEEWHTNVMPKVQVWQTVVMSKCAEKAEEWQTTVMPQCVETVDQWQTTAKVSMSKLMTRPTAESSPEEEVEDRNENDDHTMEASYASEIRA